MVTCNKRMKSLVKDPVRVRTAEHHNRECGITYRETALQREDKNKKDRGK